MSIKLKDLIDNPELLKRFKEELVDLYTAQTPEDHYYERLGELVEEHSIINPRIIKRG